MDSGRVETGVNWSKIYHDKYIEKVNMKSNYNSAAKQSKFIHEDKIHKKTFSDRFNVYLDKLIKEEKIRRVIV